MCFYKTAWFWHRIMSNLVGSGTMIIPVVLGGTTDRFLNFNEGHHVELN